MRSASVKRSYKNRLRRLHFRLLNERISCHYPLMRNSSFEDSKMGHATSWNAIGNHLALELPRELLYSIVDGQSAAAKRAYAKSQDLASGHRANGRGQDRYFLMTEDFHKKLELNNANPTPIRGNSPVLGEINGIILSRANVGPNWNHLRKSKKRRELCEMNKAISDYCWPDLWEKPKRHISLVVIFLVEFSEKNCEAPASIKIAVPNSDLSDWLFKQDVTPFLMRYENDVIVQEDFAQPRLKDALKKQSESRE